MALVAILLFTACNNKAQKIQPEGTESKVITTTLDTTIAIAVCKPVTAPRYNCNGDALPNPKLIGMRTTYDSMKISVSKTDTVTYENPSDTTTAAVPPGFAKGTTKSNWLRELLNLLLAATLIGLTIWFLWWLFRQRPLGSGGGTYAAATPGNPTARGTTGQTSEVTSERDPYEGAVAVINALQKSSAGGKVEIGDVKIEIPPKGININISASGQDSTIGDITIKAKNSETVKVDCTEDYRSFSKTTGAKKEDTPVNGQPSN